MNNGDVVGVVSMKNVIKTSTLPMTVLHLTKVYADTNISLIVS